MKTTGDGFLLTFASAAGALRCAQSIGSEIFCSAVTVGSVDGRGLTFEEHGTHELKGLVRPVKVFALRS